MKAFKVAAVAALATTTVYAQTSEGTENAEAISVDNVDSSTTSTASEAASEGANISETTITFIPSEEAELQEEGGFIMPTEFFGQTDLMMGFVVGFYGPIQSRWRDNDCRARFFNLASNLSTYSALFDKPFSPSPVNSGFLGLKVVMTAFSGMNTWNTCIA